MGERLGGCGWAFFSFEVPDMPLTLCHRSLMDPDVPQCEQEDRHLVEDGKYHGIYDSPHRADKFNGEQTPRE